MSCIGAIREHIDALPKDAVFATRDLVKYGLRNTVDQSISQLIQHGIIIRLARGVFIKSGAKRPSDFEIASYKARSFGKELVRHGKHLAEKWLCSENPHAEQSQTAPYEDLESHVIFQIRGRSSAFWYGDRRIYLHGTGDRKIHGGETKIGQLIRSLWYLGSQVGEPQLWQKIDSIPTQDLCQLVDQAQWMPAWLSDKLRMACYA